MQDAPALRYGGVGQRQGDGACGKDPGGGLLDGVVQGSAGLLAAQAFAAGVALGVGFFHTQQDRRLVRVPGLARIARVALLLAIVLLAQCALASGAFVAGVFQGSLRSGALQVALGAIGAVVAGVASERAAFQFDDVGHRVKQSPVVADDDQAAAPGADLFHEPGAGARVQVVAGFVQQQGIGAMQQDAGERDAG
ncbi:hypothetical protein D3C86_657710 [compost metagenome]